MVTTTTTPTEYRSRTTYTRDVVPGFKDSNINQKYPMEDTAQSTNFNLQNDFLDMHGRTPLRSFEQMNGNAFYPNDIPRPSLGGPNAQIKINTSVSSNSNNFASND